MEDVSIGPLRVTPSVIYHQTLAIPIRNIASAETSRNAHPAWRILFPAGVLVALCGWFAYVILSTGIGVALILAGAASALAGIVLLVRKRRNHLVFTTNAQQSYTVIFQDPPQAAQALSVVRSAMNCQQ